MSSKASEATNPPTSSEAPWYAAYPAARNKNPSTLSRVDLLASIKEGKKPGKDFVLVDLRRTDYEGGTIRGSINLPAQSLYPTIPTLYTLFKEAKVGTVIWYCGSSRGRGNRAAAWFDDYIDDRGDSDMRSVVLVDGIKGWASAGRDCVELMDEYKEEAWRK
ncbi:hypothetical protein W97_07537 [Coniosporium apollinis CBS 100218]|uniref:Rhodanese domain-containing protein n=1 Tax=Coniosporium apollinis (strain CBS 100218) TaxID=1168221 RepID=R7Z2M6_CONA1|nr:uncharacterized protein W97_07537 [Coniosporium apollinis CBS 100218]EON68279.1 hypothetical protein W97_07537 [Coniosporium apollinis CBS 100218]